MRAVVERNEHTELGAGVKQPAFSRIFTHRMHVCTVGNSAYNRAPGFAEIGRSENVRFEIVEFMSVHRYVSGVTVMLRSFDQIDRAPLRHLRRHVAPMLSIISGHVKEAV